ncbi:hypothetical protein K3495_g16498, partial [Podosphaera aphanis]
MAKKHLDGPGGGPMNICFLSGHAFHNNCKDQRNELFSTSLYELDRLLEERLPQKSGTSSGEQLGMIEDDISLVPAAYSAYLDVFSKEASDILPPHRSYDHKITLEGNGEAALTYTPLYKMSADELEAVKAYIVDNLDKGFIEPSQAPFAAPILFVKKANGALRLCIDFRKLNSVTRKDRYPLPLIDETLARIGSAKIFSKLDIRQAFHRIRMDPSSEELTTFRTRYG